MSAVQSYNWFYDYSIVLKNDARCITEFRQYVSQSIPDSIPWKPYLPDVPIPRLAPSGSATNWSFAAFNPSASILTDVSGNSRHLYNKKTTVENNALWISRRDLYPILGGGTTGYNLSSSIAVDFSSNFSWETYVYGIDATLQATSLLFISTGSTANKGYAIDFNFNVNQLRFTVGSSATVFGVASASLSTLRAELGYPPNYHHFAGSFMNGYGMFLYIDGQQVAFNSYTGSVAPASTGFLVKNGQGLFVDELTIYTGSINPNSLLTKYNLTKERTRYLGMSTSSYYPYHQARFTVFASGSNEFELHGFSVRGLSNTSASIYDPRTTDLYVTPFFSSVSGSSSAAIGGIIF